MQKGKSVLLVAGLALLALAELASAYYSPRLGRWLSRDPAGENAGPNLYAFARSSPSNLIDPDGMQATQPTPPPATNPSHPVQFIVYLGGQIEFGPGMDLKVGYLVSPGSFRYLIQRQGRAFDGYTRDGSHVLQDRVWSADLESLETYERLKDDPTKLIWPDTSRKNGRYKQLLDRAVGAGYTGGRRLCRTEYRGRTELVLSARAEVLSSKGDWVTYDPAKHHYADVSGTTTMIRYTALSLLHDIKKEQWNTIEDVDKGYWVRPMGSSSPPIIREERANVNLENNTMTASITWTLPPGLLALKSYLDKTYNGPYPGVMKLDE